MKNPRTEITNESAKFVLHAYRPNGADARDPIFRAALEQAARDPELGAWLKEQRAFDSLITGKLAEFQPPATLHSAIMAGIANRSPETPLHPQASPRLGRGPHLERGDPAPVLSGESFEVQVDRTISKSQSHNAQLNASSAIGSGHG